MSATLTANGAKPLFHPSGNMRPRAFSCVAATQAAYGVALFAGNFVTLASTGSLVAYDGTGSSAALGILGVLAGWEYTDVNGKFVQSTFLPATPTGITDVQAFVYDDPATVFEIGVNGSLTRTAIGDQLTTITTPSAGSTVVGLGTSFAAVTLAGAAAQGILRILDLSRYVDNAWGDAFVVAQVQISGHQFAAVKVAV